MLFKLKKKNKKLIEKTADLITAGIFFVIILSNSLCFYTFGDDLLEQAFKPSMQSESLIDLGNNKNAVGNEIFKEGTDIKLTTQGGLNLTTTKQAPLIVRFAKFLLRITIALSITMILYHAIKYILEATKGEKSSANTIQSLIYIAVGLFIALGSLAIINLISSISLSSL